MKRPARLAVAVVAALALALGACGGDDDATPATSTTTTEAGDGATTTTADGTGTDGPDTEPPDGEPEQTTTTAAPPVAGPDELRALLLDPEAIAEGLRLDHTFGDGTFSPDLCEDVILDATWDDQASQALSTGTGPEDTAVNQAVLAFADAATAEAFVASLLDGYQACLAQGDLAEVDAGDEAARHVVETEGITTTTDAAVRVGARVAVLRAVHPTGEEPVDDAVLAAAGDRLAG